MKYFKVTNVIDPEDEFYVSSTLPNETPTHLAMSLHLGEGDERYDIKEVTKEEFDRETEEDDDDLWHRLISHPRYLDCEDDWDYESDDDWECFQ